MPIGIVGSSLSHPPVAAPVLVDFWQDNFRVQVEARSGRLHLITEGKCRRSYP